MNRMIKEERTNDAGAIISRRQRRKRRTRMKNGKENCRREIENARMEHKAFIQGMISFLNNWIVPEVIW
jgi:adenylate kinase